MNLDPPVPEGRRHLHAYKAGTQHNGAFYTCQCVYDGFGVRLASKIENRIGRLACKATGRAETEETDSTLLPAGIGLGGGLIFAILPVLSQHWLIDLALLLAVVIGSVAIGFLASRNEWSGQTFVQRAIVASFAMASVLLVIGTIVKNPMSFSYGGYFVLNLLFFGGLGMLSAALIGRLTSRRQINENA